MALDSFVIGGLAEELHQRLENARVDKVTMPRRDRIILHLRTLKEGNVRLLLCAGNGARVHLTQEKFDNPETPPMLCMLLRKQMAGGRILSVTQPEHERMLDIRFSAVDELGVIAEKHLICEMMGRMTNLILVGPEGHIVACMHPVDPESSPRAVQPGLLYRLPPRQDKPSLWDASPDTIRQVCEEANGDAGRLCDHLAGLSPMMAREMVHRGGDAAGICAQLLQLRETQPQPWHIRKENGKTDFASTEMTHVEGTWEKYSDFCSLLDDFYREQTRAQDLKNLSGAMERTMTTVKKRLERKLAGQKQELQTAEEREKLKRTADLITANLYAIKSGDKSVTLVDYFDPELPQVKVELDPMLSPQENAQKLFGKYTRLKRAEEALTRQIELGRQELEYVENVLYTLSAAGDAAQIKEIREELVQAGYVKPTEKGKRKPKPLAYAPREFTVEGGFTVLCGRNNRENDELTHRRAGKNDIWFHARNVPGSHAVLFTEGREPSDEALRQAASIAAYFSSVANQPRVPVDYTLVRRVKKPQGAAPGMVNYFEFKTALVAPELPKE